MVVSNVAVRTGLCHPNPYSGKVGTKSRSRDSGLMLLRREWAALLARELDTEPAEGIRSMGGMKPGGMGAGMPGSTGTPGKGSEPDAGGNGPIICGIVERWSECCAAAGRSLT
mmetsp:Transcript_17567/g.38126  ORF Transcript_17567/g.38126 Transcript_17567/m.38126 type:complete len:113 (+) Transcript_17567:133-471(+)